MATIHSTRPTVGIVKRTVQALRDPLPPIDYVPAAPIITPHGWEFAGGPTDDIHHVDDESYAGAVLDALRAHTIPLHLEVCGGESPHWLERDERDDPDITDDCDDGRLYSACPRCESTFVRPIDYDVCVCDDCDHEFADPEPEQSISELGRLL